MKSVTHCYALKPLFLRLELLRLELASVSWKYTSEHSFLYEGSCLLYGTRMVQTIPPSCLLVILHKHFLRLLIRQSWLKIRQLQSQAVSTRSRPEKLVDQLIVPRFECLDRRLTLCLGKDASGLGLDNVAHPIRQEMRRELPSQLRLAMTLKMRLAADMLH